MKFSFLDEIQSQLSVLNGKENPLRPADFLIKTENQNALLVNQIGDEADLAICLSAQLLEKFQNQNFPKDFELSDFPDLSIVVEELSHFNFFCDNALRNQEVSALELEVQGEVDKFGFALECLHAQNEKQLADEVFEVLFREARVGSWVKPEEKERYFQAHDIARGFCRKVLDQTKDLQEQRKLFRGFFSAPLSKKLNWRLGA